MHKGLRQQVAVHLSLANSYMPRDSSLAKELFLRFSVLRRDELHSKVLNN